MPASLTDIFAVLQNGVAAINGLRSQLPVFPIGTGLGGTAITSATDITTTFVSRTVGAGGNNSVNFSSNAPGTYLNHTPSIELPAGFIVSGRAVRTTAFVRFATSGAGVPTINFRMRLGGTTVAENGPLTAAAGYGTRAHGQVFILMGLSAPSSSADTVSAVHGNTDAYANVAILNSIGQPVALATNNALSLDVGTRWDSSGGGTNSATLMGLLVEALN